MTPRIIGVLVAVALIAFLAIFGPSMCSGYFAQKQARKIEQGQSGATLDAVEEGNRTAAEVRAGADATRAQVEEATNDILEAPVGDRNAAADAAVCRMPAYARSERCAAMRAADSERAAGADAANRPAR